MTLTDSFHIRAASWSNAQDQRQIKHIRHRVFVLEQKIPESLEWDENDANSQHLLIYRQNRDAVGTCRLEPSGKIGRLAVLDGFREMGLGERLLLAALNAARQAGQENVYLHAQAYASEFYEKHGFTCDGEPFLEGGIRHIGMRMKL